MEIDNSQCNLAINSVKISVRQELKQKIGKRRHEDVNIIIDNEIKGPAAQQGDFKETIAVDLSKIRYEVATERKKHGVMKKLSQDDQFQMAALQPAVHTVRFSNDYYLTVTLNYDGCTCCTNLPDAKMPMTIVPLINPYAGLLPPSDFNPTDMGIIDMVANYTPMIGGDSD